MPTPHPDLPGRLAPSTLAEETDCHCNQKQGDGNGHNAITNSTHRGDTRLEILERSRLGQSRSGSENRHEAEPRNMLDFVVHTIYLLAFFRLPLWEVGKLIC